MTIEFSLRRRARQARCLAVVWLSLASAILVVTYITLPLIADKTLGSISKVEIAAAGFKSGAIAHDTDPQIFTHIQFYALGTLVLGLFAISFACFLLGRSAFVEIELAAR